MAKKKKPSVPKPRGVWKINPKTRVKPSEKVYDRARARRKEPTWVDDVSWFGEVKKT